nr:GNAT family N-acetyltransferase [Streptomyces sp. Amel2xB2]
MGRRSRGTSPLRTVRPREVRSPPRGSTMSDERPEDIRVTDQPDRSRFVVTVDGDTAGFAAYERRSGRVILTHTEVDSAYQGRGVAGRLARGALEAVRATGDRVTPSCPYIAEYIRRHQQYLDLVDEAHRAEVTAPSAS